MLFFTASLFNFYLFFLFVFRIAGKNVDGCDAVALFQSLEDDALSCLGFFAGNLAGLVCCF